MFQNNHSSGDINTAITVRKLFLPSISDFSGVEYIPIHFNIINVANNLSKIIKRIPK